VHREPRDGAADPAAQVQWMLSGAKAPGEAPAAPQAAASTPPPRN
jgi:hypothetical protein